MLLKKKHMYKATFINHLLLKLAFCHSSVTDGRWLPSSNVVLKNCTDRFQLRG